MRLVNVEIAEFVNRCNLSKYKILPLTGDASDRKYFRLQNISGSLILMDSSKTLDTLKNFLYVDDYLRKNNYSAPQIILRDLQKGFLVLEDLGEHTINQHLVQKPEDYQQIYRMVTQFISTFSKLKDPNLPGFDRSFFLEELTFFQDNYVNYIGGRLGKNEKNNFSESWSGALDYIYKNDRHNVFVHKDFHCDNLFWMPGRTGIRKIGLIDFQAARRGSQVYDITSFLYDCRSPLPLKLRKELVENYRAKLNIEESVFNNICDIYIAQRNIKILGNFTYLNNQKLNSSYLRFLPNALMYVKNAVKNPLLKDLKIWLELNKIL